MATTSLVGSLGSLTTYAAQFGVPMLSFGSSLVDFAIISAYFNGDITPSLMMYLGVSVGLTLQFLSAAYIAVKTTAAAISFIDGFYYFYAGYSAQGNEMGIYEVIFTALYLLTSLAITLTALYGAATIWSTVEAREVAVKTEGTYGTAVSMIDGIKFMALGSVVTFATWIAAYSMGQTVDELIGWFDDWTDPAHNDAPQEGYDNRDRERDEYGTSISYDFLYHAIVIVYSWFVFSTVGVLGQLFGVWFGQFKPLENCDVKEIDQSIYSQVQSLIGSYSDNASCKHAFLQMFKLVDLNKDNMVSRCENAKFLYGSGNSEEYALNYNEVKTLPGMYASCNKQFPMTTM